LSAGHKCLSGFAGVMIYLLTKGSLSIVPSESPVKNVLCETLLFGLDAL
jgi:hypothetical protein